MAVLPALLLLAMSFHFWKVRKDGGISQPESQQRVEKVTTIPHLVQIEMAAAALLVALLFVWSMLIPAPLEAPANPSHPPNPAKAAWYFMGIQELLLHMHPLAALLPGILLAGIALVYRLDDDDSNIGVYFRSPVGRRAASAGALLSVVLVPLLVAADEWWIDLPTLLPSLPALVSNGLIPLVLTLLGLAAICGIYNDYQIDELVALIRYVDWPLVGELSAQRGLIPPTLPVPEVSEDFLAQVTTLGPEGKSWAAGMQTFAQNCTVCHGIDGAGSDLGAALNTPELRTRETDELARIIREGVPGTMMASWSKVLSDDEIADVVAFLHNWDVIDAAGLQLTPPAPIEIDLTNPEEILALGQRIFDTTCSACHGENGSGGSGPVLNSQQILTRNTNEQLRATIVAGGRRPNSTMPAFGDRLTSVEIDAVVQYLRSWEPTAPSVAKPRGTDQGGGPPWLRATPDPNNPLEPGQGGGPPAGRGPNRTQGSDPAVPTPSAEQGPPISFSGEVITAQENLLTFRSDDGAVHEAMLGPPWFWAENGIVLEPGHAIELEGFQSPEHMELNWIRNLTTGEMKLLRTAEGAPVWTQ
jgi:mono/diheme cytochrome c family protein